MFFKSHSNIVAPDQDAAAIRSSTTHYTAVQIHDRSSRCWAVIRQPSGSIAEDESGELIMRLYEHEAHEIAEAMTELRRSAEPWRTLN